MVSTFCSSFFCLLIFCACPFCKSWLSFAFPFFIPYFDVLFVLFNFWEPPSSFFLFRFVSLLFNQALLSYQRAQGGVLFGKGTHILVSFDAAPPEIFWTRSWPSSVFNSTSCLVSSSLLFPQSWPVLTLADDCKRKKSVRNFHTLRHQRFSRYIPWWRLLVVVVRSST
jgi:hypothetical protein